MPGTAAVSSRWLRRLRNLVGWERLTPFVIYNRIAETTTKRAGRVLYPAHVAWWNDRSWLVPYSRYLPQPRILDRRFTLVQFARAARRLHGSTAECGVFTGVSSALICKTLEGTYGPDAFHFGFDSFEGLSEPGPRDRRPDPATAASAGAREVFRGRWRPRDLATSLETAQATLAEFTFCRLVKGWIPQSLEPAAGARFRFVHIDVDLYQPTLDSLAFFYPRLISGGICFFDEYGLLSCLGARAAVDEFLRDKPEPIIELATGQAVLVKG
jgi:O-methyltransferase